MELSILGNKSLARPTVCRSVNKVKMQQYNTALQDNTSRGCLFPSKPAHDVQIGHPGGRGAVCCECRYPVGVASGLLRDKERLFAHHFMAKDIPLLCSSVRYTLPCSNRCSCSLQLFNAKFFVAAPQPRPPTPCGQWRDFRIEAGNREVPEIANFGVGHFPASQFSVRDRDVRRKMSLILPLV